MTIVEERGTHARLHLAKPRFLLKDIWILMLVPMVLSQLAAAMPPCRHAAHAAYAAYAAYATDAYLALCRRSALRSPVH